MKCNWKTMVAVALALVAVITHLGSSVGLLSYPEKAFHWHNGNDTITA